MRRKNISRRAYTSSPTNWKLKWERNRVEVESCKDARRNSASFFSGAIEIRVGRSNGGRGESSRTTEKRAQPPTATVTRYDAKKVNGNHEQQKELVSCYHGH